MDDEVSSRRPLGDSGLHVSPVALGCWPIAGVTTLDTNRADSLATIQYCLDSNVNHLDTAYVYGPEGESERLIGEALGGRRHELVLATKCGKHFEGKAIIDDARPEVLRQECEESLSRLGRDQVELLYLHGPDSEVPLTESAGALQELLLAGKTRSVGACNMNLEQLEEFHATCPLTAVQLPYNMLQRDIERRIVPWCRERNIAVIVYWALMKGLLAGKLRRNDELAPDDSRRKYPMFQGEEWEKNQDFLDRLRQIAAGLSCTVAQLVIGWTIRQEGITTALCGAKRPDQIEETAAAIKLPLTAETLAAIDEAIAARGPAAGKRMFS